MENIKGLDQEKMEYTFQGTKRISSLKALLLYLENKGFVEFDAVNEITLFFKHENYEAP